MKLENERFLIVKKTKQFILKLEKIISSFPNREHVAKNKMIEDSFLLLETIYYINSLKSLEEDTNYKNDILVKINMLDFYLERAYHLHYINEKQCMNLCNDLTEIHKMIVAWLIKKHHGQDITI